MVQISRKLVEQLASPVVADAGLDLEQVTTRLVGRRTMIVVVVDGEGLDVEKIAHVSRQLSRVFEESAELDDAAFTLEVTSRGVAAPLTLPRHWRRNIGRQVNVSLGDGTSVKGRIGAVTETSAEVGGALVEFNDINRAVVQVEFTDK